MKVTMVEENAGAQSYAWTCGEHSGIIKFPSDERGPRTIEWDNDDELPENWEEIEEAVLGADYATAAPEPEYRSVIRELCDTIDSTGGLCPDEEGSGNPAPAGCPDWIDLAQVYLRACAVLGRRPLNEQDSDYDV